MTPATVLKMPRTHGRPYVPTTARTLRLSGDQAQQLTELLAIARDHLMQVTKDAADTTSPQLLKRLRQWTKDAEALRLLVLS